MTDLDISFQEAQTTITRWYWGYIDMLRVKWESERHEWRGKFPAHTDTEVLEKWVNDILYSRDLPKTKPIRSLLFNFYAICPNKDIPGWAPWETYILRDMQAVRVPA